METKKPGAWSAMASGMSLVFRRQRVLWWLFLVNFFLGVMAVLPVRLTLGRLLDHSLASRSLADHFDLSAFIEVLSSPQFNFGIFRSLSLVTSILFAIVVLFAEPGVIQEFRAASGANSPGRKQTAGEFFGACGTYLLRMVRLLLWSILPLAIFGLVFLVGGPIVALFNQEGASETTGLKLNLIFALILFLVLAGVRVWINLAEIELVASGEKVTRRVLFGKARKLTFGSFGKLYTIQLVTAFAVVAITLLGLTIWIKFVPPAAVVTAFVVSELTLLLLLACRLWQKASLVVWYERWVSLQPKPVEAQEEQEAPQIEPIEQLADLPFTAPAAPEVASSTAPPSDGEVPGPA